MEQRLLVLYRDKDLKQTWCIYAGGKEEADSELDLHEDGTEEISRIWVNTTAKIEFFGTT